MMNRVRILSLVLVPACSLVTNLDDLGGDAGGSPDSQADAVIVTSDASLDAPTDAPLPLGTVFSDDFDHWIGSQGPWDLKKGTNPTAITGAPSAPNAAAFLGNGSLPPDVYLKKTLALGGAPQSVTCTMQVRGNVTSTQSYVPFVALTGGAKRTQVSLTTQTLFIADSFMGTPSASNTLQRTPILSSTWEPLFLEVMADGHTLVKFAGQQFPFYDSSPYPIDSMVLELGFENPPTGTYELDVDDVACITE